MNVTVGPGSSVRFMLMSKQMACLVKNTTFVSLHRAYARFSSSSLRRKSQREGGRSLSLSPHPWKKKRKKKNSWKSNAFRERPHELLITFPSFARPRTTRVEKKFPFFFFSLFSTSIKLQRLVELLMTRGHCWNPFSILFLSLSLSPVLTISLRFAPDKTLSSPRQRVEIEKNSARGSYFSY